MGGIAYTVAAHTQDTCCKTCAADPLCTGAVYLSESSSANSSDKLSMPEPGEGFGMHLTAIPGHETTGGLSIEQVEEIFTSKVGSMDHFDWFMDYNVGFFTSSLDSYIERLRSLNTSFLSASWPALENTWYSVLVHVPGTQMVVELMGSKSHTLPLEHDCAGAEDDGRAHRAILGKSSRRHDLVRRVCVSRVVEPGCYRGVLHEWCGCQRQPEEHHRRRDPSVLPLVWSQG